MIGSSRRIALATALAFVLSPYPSHAEDPAPPDAARPPVVLRPTATITPPQREAVSDGYALRAPDGAREAKLRQWPIDLEIAAAGTQRDARLLKLAARLAVTRSGPERDAIQREAEETKEAWELQLYAIQITHARADKRDATVKALEVATARLQAGQRARREAVLAAERARGAR